MSRHLRSLCALIVALTALDGSVRAAPEEGGVRLRFSLAGTVSLADTEVTVSGRITDANSGKPIPSALVRGHVVIWRHQGPEFFKQCPYQEVRADEKGLYELRFVTPLTTSGPMKGKDSICVDASAPGYETRPLFVKPSVTPEKTTFPDVDVAMGPGKLVQGTVVDENNSPIKGAVVRVQNGWSGNWNYFGSLGKASTDENGRFKIWASQDERVISKAPWLRISKQGYGTGFFWDLLEKESMGTLIVPRGGTISGRVVNTAGDPVAGCRVLVLDFWPNELDNTITDEEGKYELKGIPGESDLSSFFERKNKRKPAKLLLKVTVYARRDAALPLADVPQYRAVAQDAQSVTGPDLVIGANTSVSGKLIPSKTTPGLQGLMVRLDTDWNKMVEADAEGKFHFRTVSPGKHRLTVYLPQNLRGDRGIGQAQIDVQQGEPVRGVDIRLETLAEVRVQFLDADGNPLEGIVAGATWTKSGDGFWTEGGKSDQDGRAVLYLYAGTVQYVRGFDRSLRGLVAEACKTVEPEAGQVIGNLRIAMIPPAAIEGRLLDENDAPVTEKRLVAHLSYADGIRRRQPLETDPSGNFEIAKLVPGVVRFRVESVPLEISGRVGEAVEIKPGQTRELGEITMSRVKFHKVSGKVLPSATFSNLEGFKIRLGLAAWEPMVSTDREGRFTIDKVPAGKHRLTAYLPHNLRTNRGVGHVSVTVQEGSLKAVELPLETLATVRMRIVDPAGKPIPGIAAAAWWTEDHSGVFTEGTKSDASGRATLYVYPDDRQYLGAHDWKGTYRLKSHREMTLQKGAVVKDLTVTMVRE